MIILGIDSSGKTASAAVSENGIIIASGYINKKITHSETLIPLMENVLSGVKLTLADIDAFAVANGPGSFTGIRIAVSAVKGMAFALGKEIYSVSTLHALAYNLIGFDCIAVPAMDARRNQVYNAVFRIHSLTDEVQRLTEDRAISAEALKAELKQYKDEKIIILGDGAELILSGLDMGNASIAPPLLRYQNAASICLMCGDDTERLSADSILPEYLRLSQAEREKQERNGN